MKLNSANTIRHEAQQKCGNTRDAQLRSMHRLLNDIASKLERSNFCDYVAYVCDNKRIFKRSFIAGLLRGFGNAVGFVLLGALLIYILQRIAQSHLPIIADFIAELIEIVNARR